MDSNVFVTGATGLIGGELTRALMQMPIGRLYALIRATEHHSPQRRLRERLSRSGVEWADFDRTVEAVAGDLSCEHLGLSQDDHQRIRRDVDVIIHSAAETSFIRAVACRRTNVAGTRRLIEFARGCERRPLLVYISTAYVSGVAANAHLSEEDSLRSGDEHHNEYTRSKAIAEEMVRASGLPALIVRPSVVLSAGLADPAFARAILWFVPLLSELDAAPISPFAKADVVPVQHVVSSLLGLLQQRRRRYDCYHVSAGEDGAVTHAELSRVLDVFYERPHPLRLIPPSHWTRDVHREYVRTPQQRRIFASLRGYLPFLNMNVHYRNDRLREELGERFPHVTPLSEYFADLVGVISSDCVSKRMLRAVRA